MKKILVTILNYHEGEYIINLLEDIYKQLGDYDIYTFIGDIQPNKTEKQVLLNSIYKLKNNNIHYLEINDNLGYARGNNFIIKKAIELIDVDYIVVTNPDITIEKNDVFNQLVGEIKNNIDALIVAPKIKLVNGKQQGPYLKQNPYLYAFKHIVPFIWLPFYKIREYNIKMINKPEYVWRTIGAFMLIKAKEFIDIGMFDESTFMYWEEDILALKMKETGKKYLYVPYIEVTHLHDVSKKRSDKSEEFFRESMGIYFKYEGYSKLIIYMVCLSRKIYHNVWFKGYSAIKSKFKEQK